MQGMDIKVFKIAGDSNINAAVDAAVEEIKQNMAVNIDCIGVKAGYQTVKVLILLTEKLVKMGYKFYMRPFYVIVDTFTHEHDTIAKTAIRWTLIAKKK
jgi:stage V sporulation protein SpoVS